MYASNTQNSHLQVLPASTARCCTCKLYQSHRQSSYIQTASNCIGIKIEFFADKIGRRHTVALTAEDAARKSARNLAMQYTFRRVHGRSSRVENVPHTESGLHPAGPPAHRR